MTELNSYASNSVRRSKYCQLEQEKWFRKGFHEYGGANLAQLDMQQMNTNKSDHCDIEASIFHPCFYDIGLCKHWRDIEELDS